MEWHSCVQTFQRKHLWSRSLKIDHEMGTSLWSRRTRKWRRCSWEVDGCKTAESIPEGLRANILGLWLASVYLWRKQQDEFPVWWEFQRCLIVHSCSAVQGHTGGNLIALDTNGKNSCFIDDALMMYNQSSDQDSSLEDEKAKKEYGPSSSHSSIHSGTSRWKIWRWLLQVEKSTQPQQVENSSGRRLLDQLSPNTRQRTTVLANQIPRRNCFYSSVPADCIYKVISRNEKRTFFERLSTPRPAPKIVLKSAWQSQQQQQQYTSESAASSTRKLVRKEEQGTPTENQNYPASGNWCEVLSHLLRKKSWTSSRLGNWRNCTICNPERWRKNGSNSESGWQITNWISYQINHSRFGNARKIHQVQRRVESYNSRSGQYWIARSGTDIQNRPVPILLEAHTGGIDLLLLRHLSLTWWGNNTKNQSQIPDHDSSLLPYTSELLKR